MPPPQQRDHGRQRGGIAGAHFEKQSAEDAREYDSNGELVRATSDDVGGIVDRRVVWMKGYGYADLRLSARLEDGSGAYPIATTR